jgi:hypothetical protein
MNFITEISRVKQLMGLIKESLSDGERVIWYNKCEGGIGKIDPNSFIFNGKQIDEETKEERDVILFKKEPNLEYNEGDSKSIPTCLGEDRPLTGRCFNIYPCGENQECATYEVDCDTKKNLW